MSEVQLGLIGIAGILTFEIIVLLACLKFGNSVTKLVKWFIRTKVDKQ